MDVAVESNRDRRTRKAAKLSVMGEGLLERARSTTLALLGGVAAIGLIAVGLALNQGWPLLPESPLPAERPVVRRPGGGGGSGGEDSAHRANASSARRGRARVSSDAEPRGDGGAVSTPAASGDGGESIATSSPVASAPSGKTKGGGKKPSPPIQKPQEAASPNPVAQPVSTAAPPQQSQPGPTELESEPEPESDPATASAAPENGNAWGWDNGQARGHDHDHDHGWGHDYTRPDGRGDAPAVPDRRH